MPTMKPVLSVASRIAGIQHMQVAMNTLPSDRAGYKEKVEVIVTYRCTTCGESHYYKDEAAECCSTPAAPDDSASTCPICGSQNITPRDAADCCLWKDLDAATRWAIADAVEDGSSWADELGINPYTANCGAAR